MWFLVELAVKLLRGLEAVQGLMRKIANGKNQVKQYFTRKKESVKPMKKTMLIAVIAALAAIAGALAAIAVYLHRREKELDEYEKLLFDETGEDLEEEETPAEEPAAEEEAAEEAEVEAE